MLNPVLFSSKSTVWETPQALFDELDREFHFETDVCALPENAKCKRFFTPEMDVLKQEWTGVCWCNPPYGRAIAGWVKKAAESKATTVMLLPNRTDMGWFHEYVLGKTEVRFIRGRLKFGGAKYNAPFGSMIVIFRNEEKRNMEYTKESIEKAMTSADRAEDAGKGQEWQMGLYERTIKRYGQIKQVTKAVEELGELAVELSRWLLNDGAHDEHLLSHIKEELADVCVMTDQLQLIFGDVSDWEMHKLERLERKLERGL